MIRFLKYAAPIALLTVAGCAEPFQARVSRYQALPAPQGQSFAVVADSPRENGSLEFRTYADMVANRLQQVGYVRAGTATGANLIVSINYGVDRGHEKIRSTVGSGFGGFGYGGGFGYSRFGGYGGFGRPYYGYGFGRRAFVGGFYDPFLFDDYNRVESYTVYNSQLQMTIERQGTKERVFEGKAQAISTDDDLTTLVPNLIDAMFTGFPGNSGETVKITVAPPGKTRR
ncbi:DUF4136 domain-containing protein [Sphingomonas paeninsulae]|jgi:hypothetical protein|uniref:DUF4136 domain-containing protein n=1 Tax=Sphingomonas paeninsulae TaxID=2319844 RepID=A0A494TJC7_SPHPE|nr:DUF4136 domain-containing protein [Sphingomonas paeninsulae]AYJ85906.1 DUF4136 domain-containing protein [Sphingomonas paeninsulae]